MKIEAEVTVINKKGLHARPAAIFVGLAEKFDVVVTLSTGTDVVNGRSIMGILMLGAVVGTVLKITVEGKEASAAMEEFKRFFNKQEEEFVP